MEDKSGQNVASPCVNICSLNERDVCVGCYRTVQEIREWALLPEERKREILRLTNIRYAQQYE